MEVTSPCPTCGTVAARTTYDIGSGPELSCAECEWCWGAEGQPLKALRLADLPAEVRAHLPEWAVRRIEESEATTGFSCPDCPMCGQPPQIQFSDQAFCGNDDCRVLTWIPSRTRAENLAAVTELPRKYFEEERRAGRDDG